MDLTKYRNVLVYVKTQKYPKGFSKQAKLTLRKYCKKFEYDDQTDSLFYNDKRRDGSALRRLVINENEKCRVFDECHSAGFSGHAGRDNTVKKIRQRYFWPKWYSETVDMVRKFNACFNIFSVGDCLSGHKPVYSQRF